jgi:glycosyltransferase involved in cell wall biosynthesis
VVEATDWALLFLPWVAAEKRAPVVVSLHGSCGQVDWFGKCEPRSLDGDLIRMVEAAALRGADVVHANSRANADFWQEKTGREIRVIPPAYGGGTKADLTTECTEDTEDSTESKDSEEGVKYLSHGGTESTEVEAWACLARQAGASESDSPASKLAVAPVSESLIRSSDAPASSPAASHPLRATAPQALKGLVVGRLQNWKGAEVLCKALRLAPEIEIEWAGGDTDWGTSGMKASEYLAANYPDVFGKRFRWIGRLDREKVAEKMQAAAFLVVPSLWDVFNLTVAEGMEAGLPVICSRAAGAEMLIEHGISGFLFDPAKPEELADSLKCVPEMLEAERVKMVFSAQEAVKTLLDESRILNLLEKSYRYARKRGVTTSKENWLVSLLSAGPEQVAPLQLNLAQRAIRKAGRILAHV